MLDLHLVRHAAPPFLLRIRALPVFLCARVDLGRVRVRARVRARARARVMAIGL